MDILAAMINRLIAPLLLVLLTACGGGLPRQAEAPTAPAETAPRADAAPPAQPTEAPLSASESAAPAGPDDGCPDRFPAGAAKILQERGYRYRVDAEAARQVVADDFDGDGDCDAAAILTGEGKDFDYRLVTALSEPGGAWRVDDVHGWSGSYSGRPWIVPLPAGAYRKERYGLDLGPSEVDAIDSPRPGFLVNKGDEGGGAFFFDAGKFSFVGQMNEMQKRGALFGEICERLLETPPGTDLAEVERAIGVGPRRRLQAWGPTKIPLMNYSTSDDLWVSLVVEDVGGGKYAYRDVHLVDWRGRRWEKKRDKDGEHSLLFLNERSGE